MTKRHWLGIGAVALMAGVVAIAFSAAPGDDPVPIDPGEVAAGAELFRANCAECHGERLDGTDVGPPLLVPTYAPNHHADEAFQRAVAFGVQAHHWRFGPMPPVEGLSRDDVASIVAFVRSEQQAAGIFEDPAHP